MPACFSRYVGSKPTNEVKDFSVAFSERVSVLGAVEGQQITEPEFPKEQASARSIRKNNVFVSRIVSRSLSLLVTGIDIYSGKDDVGASVGRRAAMSNGCVRDCLV